MANGYQYAYAFETPYDEIKFLRQQSSSLRQIENELRNEIQLLKSEAGIEEFKQQCQAEADAKCAATEEEYNALRRQFNALRNKLENANTHVEQLKEELAKARKEGRQNQGRIRDLEKELCESQKELNTLKEREGQLQKQLQEEQDKSKQAETELARLRAENIALGGKSGYYQDKAEKLEAQKNKGSHNSGIPTSGRQRNARVPNNRQQTGKPQGGQSGHKPAPRKVLQLPSLLTVNIIGTEDRLWHDPNYMFDGYVVKHIYTPVMTVMDSVVYVPQFRHVVTNARKNVEWPESLKDEVNYSAEMKAVLYLLNNGLHVATGASADCVKELFLESFAPCKSFVNGLSVEFALKSSPERALTFSRLLGADVMNIDGTTVHVGGKQYSVTICISGPYTLYIFKPRKGKDGVTDTPIEHTTAILVHDHDIVYYSYGSGHQECLEHILRYLVSSIENETELSWNIEMHTFLQRLIHESNEVDRARAKEAKATEAAEDNQGDADTLQASSESPRARFSEEMIREYKDQFINICLKGKDEYKDGLPHKWFPDGRNLCKRLSEHPDDYLRFLEDDRIPATNGVAEVGARQFKRKQNACGEFRGFLGVIAYCEGSSVLASLRSEGKLVLPTITEIFRREIRTEDRLSMQNKLIKVLTAVVDIDANTLERDEKQKRAVEESLNKAKSVTRLHQDAYNAFKESHPDVVVSEQQDDTGNYSTNEEADSLVKDMKSDLHAEFVLQRELDQIVKNIAFDTRHKEKVEKQLEEAKKNAERYAKEIEREKASPASTTTASSDDVKPLEESLTQEQLDKVHDAANENAKAVAEFHQASEELSEAHRNFFFTFNVPGIPGCKRNPNTNKVEYAAEIAYTEEEKNAALEHIQELQNVVKEKLSAVAQTSKTLDQLRKNIQRRNYKKRMSKKEETEEKTPA